MEQKSILFVCTGNTFRSAIAEQSFRKYLNDNNIPGWKVGSAGIIARKDSMDPKTVSSLEMLGVSSIKHRQKKLTRKMLKRHDIIVAMAENHAEFIKTKLGFSRVLLFNELATNKKTSVLDIQDEVKDYRTNRRAVERKIEKTACHIFRNIPNLFKNASERYYLFSDFVDGYKTHRNGFPFIRLHETKNTVSFMSINIPSKEDGHILIIPKKRYPDLSEIPKNVLNELSLSIQQIGAAISKNHGGYNLLLNNGIEAGQWIYHTHFHIVPRKYNDGIKIEVWKHQNISIKKFIYLNRRLRRQIQSAG
ncbi:MAG: HIT domain-containing protein [Candidatus Aenigmarchaeota archaeon]|nr:HIT domain-containing protein [Candidatus Aenigmarchaeota archaeon]